MSNVFDDIVHIAKAQSDAYHTAYQTGYSEGYRLGYAEAIAACQKIIKGTSFEKPTDDVQ